MDTYTTVHPRVQTFKNIGTGMILMFFLMTGFQLVYSVAAAPTPTEQARAAQSSIYDTSTNAQNSLRQVIDQLEYIKATSHSSASLLDPRGK